MYNKIKKLILQKYAQKDTHSVIIMMVFEGLLGSDGKESACDEGNPGFIPGSGRSPEGHGNPLQYSSLENSME